MAFGCCEWIFCLAHILKQIPIIHANVECVVVPNVRFVGRLHQSQIKGDAVHTSLCLAANIELSRPRRMRL